MRKKSFIPSERYAAPEMTVVELNLNTATLISGSLKTGVANTPGEDISEDGDYTWNY